MAIIYTKPRKNPKVPLLVVVKSGGKTHKMAVPDQHKYKTAFLRDHGCSIMAEYVALQWCGINIYKPTTLLKLHRKHTKADVKAKVTIRGVYHLMRDLLPFADITFKSRANPSTLKKQLSAGKLVLFEEGNPIHTVVLLKAGGAYWRITNGHCNEISIDEEAKRRTQSKTYAGVVFVGDIEG